MNLDNKIINSIEIACAIPCAFINSNSPEKATLGPWISFNIINDEKLILIGTRKHTYPHPEAPENATISVLVEEEICRASANDLEYGVLFGLMQAQNTTKLLLKQKINRPPGPPKP